MVDQKKVVIDTLKQLPFLEANLEMTRARVEAIQKALSSLSVDERAVVCRHIIKGESPLDIAFDLHVEKTQFYRKRDSALAKVGIALFGQPIECLSEESGEKNEGS